MKEQVNDVLLRYLKSIETVAGQAIDFSKQEVPAYIQEMLAYEFYQTIILLVLCVVVSIISVWPLKLGVKRLKESNAMASKENYKNNFHLYLKHYDVEGAGMMAILLGGFILSVSLSGVAITANYAVKIKVAPRVVIVEKLKELVK